MTDVRSRLLEAAALAAEEPVVLVDADEVIIVWNPAAERVLGYTAAEVLGKPLSMLWPPPLAPAARTIRQRLAAGEGVTGRRTYRRHKDGHDVPVQLTITPVLEDGRLVGSASVLRDLTLERSRQRRDAWFDALLRNSFDAVVVLNDQADILEVFFGGGLPFGYPADSVVGRSSWDFVHPDDRPHVEVAWERALQTPGPQPPVEFRIRLGDGSWGWAEEVISNVLHEEAVGALVVNIRDITDRRRAEEAHHLSEQRYRRAVQSAPDAIAITDSAGTVTLANPNLGALLGVDAEDLVGRQYDDLGLPEPADVDGVPVPFSHADEPERWLQITSTPMPDAQDAGGERLVWVRDLTEQVAMHARRVELERLEALGRFASGVAHDFNNLLQVVRGQAELIARGLPEDAPARDDVEGLYEAVRRAGDQVAQLTAFARGQALTPVALDLVEHLPGVVDFCRRLVPERVTLTLAPPSQPVTAYVDPAQLDRVVVNLVDNAGDAIEGAGRIEVAVAEGSMPGDPAQAAAVLTVTDTGAGMPPEVAARCFEPFFTTKGPGAGTGLGLASSYGIVQQSGGTMEVESAPGAGTRMTVYWPAADPAATPEGPAAAAGGTAPAAGSVLAPPDPAADPTAALDGPVVLVVDDDPAVRATVARVLGWGGYRVRTASDGATAVTEASAQALSGEPVALVVSDVQMPGECGVALTGRLLDDGLASSSLLMTGANLDHLVPDGVPLLHKPFTAEDLLSRVRALMEGPVSPRD